MSQGVPYDGLLVRCCQHRKRCRTASGGCACSSKPADACRILSLGRRDISTGMPLIRMGMPLPIVMIVTGEAVV